MASNIQAMYKAGFEGTRLRNVSVPLCTSFFNQIARRKKMVSAALAIDGYADSLRGGGHSQERMAQYLRSVGAAALDKVARWARERRISR